MPRRSARAPETFYPLHVRICAECLLVQLPAYVAGEDIFSDYAYFSSYSDSWVEHARRYADAMTERLGLDADSLVAEVASNDGYLLQHFVAAGIPVLGVEPAGQHRRGGPRPRASAPRCASSAPETGAAVAAQYGRADLVAGEQRVRPHPGHRRLHRRPGRAGQAGRAGHAGVPAPAAADRAPPVRHDLPRALPVPVAAHRVAGAGHGRADRGRRGGARARTAARCGCTPGPPTRAGEPLRRVKAVLDAEAAAGLHTLEGHAGFAEAVFDDQARPARLPARSARAEGKRVVGYGAPGKGNTLLNHCGIRADLLAYTVDRSPHKQGMFLPGTHIPIHAPGAHRRGPARLRARPAVEPAHRDHRAACLRARLGRPAGRSRSRPRR